jgi:hypothetical protein
MIDGRSMKGEEGISTSLSSYPPYKRTYPSPFFDIMHEGDV